jgi:hypothetical protein
MLKILDHFADKDLNSFFDVRQSISYLYFVYSYCHSVLTVIIEDRVQCQASVNPALTHRTKAGCLLTGRVIMSFFRNTHQGVCLVFDNCHEIYHICMNI